MTSLAALYQRIPLWAVFLILVLGSGVYQYYAVRRRRRELAAWAMQSGWSFATDEAEPDPDSYGQLDYFRQGRSQGLANRMQPPGGESSELLADHSFVTGSGKNSHTHAQTIFLCRLPFAALPQFSLHPENLGHKLLAMFGMQDVDFADDPEFSRRFLLRGADEDAVRARFSPLCRAALAPHAGWSLEGDGEWLVLYRNETLCPPAGLQKFIADARIISGLFSAR
ncbi:MAG TPA: hypothetical protein PKM88_07500 [bacterium]|nr:hypothetical protein [bacterium]